MMGPILGFMYKRLSSLSLYLLLFYPLLSLIAYCFRFVCLL